MFTTFFSIRFTRFSEKQQQKAVNSSARTHSQSQNNPNSLFTYRFTQIKHDLSLRSRKEQRRAAIVTR